MDLSRYKQKSICFYAIFALILVSILCFLPSCKGADVSLTTTGEKDSSIDTNDSSTLEDENLTLKDDDFIIENGVLILYHGKGGDVVIPDGVVTISETAFAGNNEITGITIPPSVKENGFSLFAGCNNIEKVAFSEGITEIKELPFYDLSVKSLSIPASVTTFDSHVYKFSQLENIIVEEGNLHLKSIDGVLFNHDMTVLLKYPTERRDAEYTVPETVKTITTWAFFPSTYIKKINIPESVTEIEADAFSCCKSLESVNLPSGITKIPSSAFVNCESLTDITISNGVKIIETSAFAYCRSLEKIHIPESVVSVAEGAFSGCSKLKDITVDSTIIGKLDIQKKWEERLKKEEFVIKDGVLIEYNGIGGDVVIPAEVKRFKLNVFTIDLIKSLTIHADCEIEHRGSLSKVSNFYVAEGNPYYKDIDGVLFSADGSKLLAYPRGREGGYVIPDGTKVIAESVFIYNNKITSLTIPESVKKIEGYAIFCCESLNEINVIQDGRIEIIGAMEHVPWVNTGGFVIEDGVLIDYVGIGGNIVVPDGVTKIADKVFSDKGRILLLSVKLPEGLTEIGDEAFYGQYYNESVNFPQSLKKIGESAFCQNSLVNIRLPDSIEYIGEQAFSLNRRLTTVVLPSNLTEIFDETFSYCFELRSIFVPESVTKIGSNAFYACEKLDNLILHKNVEIGEDAFVRTKYEDIYK